MQFLGATRTVLSQFSANPIRPFPPPRPRSSRKSHASTRVPTTILLYIPFKTLVPHSFPIPSRSHSVSPPTISAGTAALISVMASTDPDREEESAAAAEDEDTGAQITPIIKLEEVAVTTGEEDEDVLLDLKAKLYRFDRESNQWKERGTGSVKLLKHKETGKVRLVMRQSKTLKIVANHFVTSSIKLQEHAGNEKSCVWHATDYSDGELKAETFCIRFGSIENCKKFMDMFENVSGGNTEEKESEDVSAAAGLTEKLSLSEGSASKDDESRKMTPAAADEEEAKPKTETEVEKPSPAT